VSTLGAADQPVLFCAGGRGVIRDWIFTDRSAAGAYDNNNNNDNNILN